MPKITEKQIEGAIETISGPLGIKVYKVLKNHVDVNEFDIATKLGMEINVIRNTLYKFEKHNLVTFFRKKDRKKGWYLYFYTFNKKEAEYLVIKLKKKTIILLEKHILDYENHEYYVCPNKDSRKEIEEALEQNFICTECGEILQPQENTIVIKKLKKEVDLLKIEAEKLEK